MNWVLHETLQQSDLSSSSPPPPPPPSLYDNPSFQNRISPSILLIILILAIIFFISGLLHLLVRFLKKPNTVDPQESENSTTAFQGQLQQLFDLHDSGVDQSFIDALPIFLYKAIIGLKDPFDCAVCLCEFNQDDKLRLLPQCSHAFHFECIDTWLLSHSTCPLCRRSLLDYSPNNNFSPLVFVLGSGTESSREIGTVSDRREISQHDRFGSFAADESGTGTNGNELGQKTENLAREETCKAEIVQVKLGKFRSTEKSCVALDEGTSSGSGTDNVGTKNLDKRRCYSMGSYEYVMDERSSLTVPIKPPKKKLVVHKPRHRAAMSECDCHSKRELGFKGLDQTAKITDKNNNESFSISKIWLRFKENRALEADSRRSVSFRFPFESNSRSKISTSPMTESEYNVSSWDKSGSVENLDLESGICENRVLRSRADEAPSFARRTLLWIMGRHEQR
ncbi:hypothetical protein LUZ60_002871 [Juncus effusus]|nr:hypothetical protein LUZ60_002871 [Juncus effusus]